MAGGISGGLAPLIPVGATLGGVFAYGALDGLISGVIDQGILNLLSPCREWNEDLLLTGITSGFAGALTAGVFDAGGRAASGIFRSLDGNRFVPSGAIPNAVRRLSDLNFLNRYQPGDAFSGVYDPSTSAFLVRPSGNTASLVGDDIINWVDQFGGHGQLNDILAQRGINPDGTVGFVVFYDAPRQLSVGWNSGSVNFRNFNNPAAPQEFRQSIIDALAQASGFNVISR